MTETTAIATRIREWDKTPQGPWTLELHPTLRCNLACAFCDTALHDPSTHDDLPPGRILSLVDEAAELGVQRVFVLGGGEPLLSPVASRLMALTKRHGMEGILNTNGTLLDARLARQLVETGWDEIHFSVDGPSASIHDRLRGRQGAFKSVIQAICRLGATKESLGRHLPRVALHFVLTRHNHHTLLEMLRLAHTLGAFRVDFDVLVVYRPEHEALVLLDSQRREMPQRAEEALAEARRLGIATTLANLLDPGSLARGQMKITGSENPSTMGPFSRAPCLRAWHHLVVSANGRTSPCCVLAGTGESLAQTSLREVWEKGVFLEEVRETMLAGVPLPRCRECSANILAHERHIRQMLG